MHRLFLFFLALALVLSFCACGDSSNSTPTPVVSVAVSPNSTFTIAQGQTSSITATVTNDSANKGVTWAVTGQGCTGDACGTLTNTTTTAATYNTPAAVATNLSVTVTATSVADASKSASVSFTVAPLPSITVNSLSGGTHGASYSSTVTATGGVPPLKYSVSAGSLPGGLALNANTGAITGTPTALGVFDFTVQVADSSTPALTATKALSIKIDPAPLSVTTATLPAGVELSAYTATLASTGGTAPVTWAVTSGSLPAGLTLDGATGAISGAATVNGTITFTVTATDSATPAVTATKDLTIVIHPALSITTASLPDGTINTAYTTTLVSSDGTAPVSWSISAGSLPTGLTLNANSGVISGTPTALGKADFTVRATDSSTPARSVDVPLSITIKPAPLSITTTTLPNGVELGEYSASLASSGGTAPVTWAVTTGSLPAGLALDGATGAISGTPSEEGTVQFTVTATDSATPAMTATKDLTILIRPALSITTTTLPDGSINTAYTTTVVSSGGTAPVSWSVSVGSLPAGLTLNSNTGAISGTPTAAGKTDFTVKATDSTTPPHSAEVSLSITIAATPLAITTTTLPNATIGTAYTTTLVVTGGTPPIKWSVSTGTLPSWATLDPDAGTITGTPDGTPMSTTFTLMATDSGSPVQTQTQSLTLTTITSGVNNSELNGNYAFVLRGFETGSQKLVTMAGSFLADGSGTITGGRMDIVTAAGTTQTNLTITSGTYSVAADNRGTLSLTTSQGTNTFKFALGSITAGVSSQGTIIGANSNVVAGMLKKQNTGAFTTASFNGKYAFGMSGVASSGRFVSAGVMTMDGAGAFTAVVDANENGLFGQQTFTGTYGVSDATYGRGTLNDTTNGSHMAVYVVSASEVFVIQTDGFGTGAPVFTGRALKQTVPSFGNTSLNGVSVLYEMGVTEGMKTKVSLALITTNGAGTANYAAEKNSEGTLSSESQSFTYTVAPNGRVSISGSGTPIFYLVSAGTGFMVGTEPSVSEGFMELQTGSGTFTNASISGSYTFGTIATLDIHSAANSGVVTADGAGHLTGSSDYNGGGTVGSDTFSQTYSVAANGRVTGLEETLLYIISPTKALMLDTGSQYPSVSVILK